MLTRDARGLLEAEASALLKMSVSKFYKHWETFQTNHHAFKEGHHRPFQIMFQQTAIHFLLPAAKDYMEILNFYFDAFCGNYERTFKK